MTRPLLFIVVLFSLLPPLRSEENIEQSVVQVICVNQQWRFDTPWRKNRPQSGSGTGFVIEGDRIMTNAHIVADATYIEVRRLGDDKRHEAVVEHVAHDCDLAVLRIKTDGFFNTMVPLKFGRIPELNSVVTTQGFPLGGTQISVTRGVVSRIQLWTYSHSGADNHLVIQTDAAINPGNSGGPVLQDGEVVGVAFQGLRQADNIGYMIPVTVVEHFLTDIQDGTYNGFGELGFSYRTDLQNPSIRKLLNVPDDKSGVVVTRTFPGMPAYEVLQPMDVLLAINDLVIRDDGQVLLGRFLLDFSETLERMQEGEEASLEILRDGKEQTLKLKTKTWRMVIPHSRPHDVVPDYYMVGGLCFTPLTRGYLNTLGSWSKVPLEIRVLYREGWKEKDISELDNLPVLSVRLPHDFNTGTEEFVGQVVESVNDSPVRGLQHLKELVESAETDYLSFQFRGMPLPLVLPTKGLKEIGDEILLQYQVPAGERL